MEKYASDLLNAAKGWLGCNEKDGSHKQIVDVYNAHKPLARGYKVKYTDAWCATFVSACAIVAGMTDIIPTECSCEKMISLFKNISSWVEEDNHVPSTGDILFYDWQDSGSGDNTGWADHVGIVESCDGKNIVVIEGNCNEAVAYRTLRVGGLYIRGYGIPKFYKREVETPVEAPKKEAEEIIWDFLMSKLNNSYGVAGLMGNLYAESGLVSNNAQNSGNRKLGMTDAEYTNAVDNGSYANFVRDSVGYGLAQWTYWSRKEALLNFANSKKVSIGNLEMQLEFLMKEITGYKTVYNTLLNAKSIREASDAVLTGYERPANMSEEVKQKRASHSQRYYDKYAKTSGPISAPVTNATISKKVATKAAKSFDKSIAGTYTVTASKLHLRNGAGTLNDSMVVMPKDKLVKNYGYYTTVLGTKWLYIQTVVNGVQYTGFSSSKYLKRV